MLLETFLKTVDPTEFVLRNRGCGNARPQLDHVGNIVFGQFDAVRFGFEFVEACAQAQFLGLNVGNFFVPAVLHLRVARNLAFQCFTLVPELQKLVADFITFRQYRRGKRTVRRRLVDQVDRFVRQETVGDIPLGQHHRPPQNLVRNRDGVEFLVVMLDALQHFHRLVHRRLVYRDRLEAALQSGILFDILAVFVQRGCADDLHFAARQRGLEDVRRIDASLRFSRADDVVHLVDDKNRISNLAHLAEKPENAGFELPAELRSRNKSGHVDQINFLSAQFVRDISRRNADGKRLGNRGLSDTRLADQAGIVLLPAAENLNHARQFPVTPDDVVELSFPRKVG